MVSEIQAATTNAGTRAQGGLTPDFLALSIQTGIAVEIELREPGELADRLGQRAQLEVGQIQHPRTEFPGLLDAAQGFFRRRVARELFKRPFKGPFRHTRRNVKITDALLLLCRMSF